jgi:putative ABC transport system substrate-binding protein
MRRREFVTLLISVAAWPVAPHSQQPAMPVVGYLGVETPERFGSRLTAFRQGLSEMGYEEGRNVIVEYRWANGQNDRLPALAADLVNRKVAVIAVPGSGFAALAAKDATKTIPIVFVRRKYQGHPQASWHLHGPHFEGRETSGPASSAGNQG